MKTMLTPAQAGERLGFNTATVIRLIKSGELPAMKLGRWRIDPDDLEAFISKKKFAANEPSPAASAALCDVPSHPRFA